MRSINYKTFALSNFAKMPAIRTRSAIASDLKVARSRLTRARNAHTRSDGGEEAEVLLGAILEHEGEVAELLVERATLYPPVAAGPEEAVQVAAALEAAVPVAAAPEAAVPGMAVQEAAVPDAEGLAEGAQAASFAELARAILAGLTQNGAAIRSLTTALTKRERQGEEGVELPTAKRRRQEMSPWERALADAEDDDDEDDDSQGGGARGGALGLGSDWRVLDPATWGPLRTGEDLGWFEHRLGRALERLYPFRAHATLSQRRDLQREIEDAARERPDSPVGAVDRWSARVQRLFGRVELLWQGSQEFLSEQREVEALRRGADLDMPPEFAEARRKALDAKKGGAAGTQRPSRSRAPHETARLDRYAPRAVAGRGDARGAVPRPTGASGRLEAPRRR